MAIEKLSHIAVPALMAVAGLALALLASGGGAINVGEAAATVNPLPTPYSADHARVQLRPGGEGDAAPTF